MRRPAAAPTKSNAPAPAKKNHAATAAQDPGALLANTTYHNGIERMELCGYFTHDPESKKHFISMKSPTYDFTIRTKVDNACNDLVFQGGATKSQILELKVKMIADLAKA